MREYSSSRVGSGCWGGDESPNDRIRILWYQVHATRARHGPITRIVCVRPAACSYIPCFCSISWNWRLVRMAAVLTINNYSQTDHDLDQLVIAPQLPLWYVVQGLCIYYRPNPGNFCYIMPNIRLSLGTTSWITQARNRSRSRFFPERSRSLRGNRWYRWSVRCAIVLVAMCLLYLGLERAKSQ